YLLASGTGALLPTLAGFADTAHPAIEHQIELGGAILDLAEIGRVEPAVVFQRRKLNGIQFLRGGEIEKFETLPFEGPQGVGIEAQFHRNLPGRSGAQGRGSEGQSLQKSTPEHDPLYHHRYYVA